MNNLNLLRLGAAATRIARPGTRRFNLIYTSGICIGIWLSWQLTISLGGAGVVAPHWFYLPIILTAYRFGHRATLLTSLVVTAAAGPLLPDHFAAHAAVGQATSDWITRGFAFVVLGQALAALFRRLRRERDGARAELAQRRLAESNLARQDARFAAMVARSSDLTTIVSADGVVNYQSGSVWRMLGWKAEELLGSDFPGLLHPDDRGGWTAALVESARDAHANATAEWRLRTADGGYVSVESEVANLLDDPAVCGIVLNSRDVSERKRLEEELRHQAFHDSLTGLANRALFQDRLEQALARLERTKGVLGVLFVDLDKFKAVNDGRGHNIGDELLHAVAVRLRDAIRIGDTVARLGGDEFGMLVEGSDAADAQAAADRVIDVLRLPFLIDDNEIFVHTSIGIATTASGLDSAGELLRNADVAMYAAKNAGGGRWEAFHTGLHDQVIGRLQIEADLGRAVERDELVIHFQPIYDVHATTVTGVEALLRWNHPQRGIVAPGDFIPAAETSGHIVAIGRWLLGAACRQAKALAARAELPDLRLSVNISARQLEDAQLVNDVAVALAESGFPADRLTLEITESAFMSDANHSIMILKRLKSLGVKLSIDDFGTGYSSLAYLQRLPVDELKIDRSFITATLDGSEESSNLVRTIIGLARSFGLKTVAEGIETDEQLSRLQLAGCELAQGYLFARPMNADRLCRLLAKPNTLASHHADAPSPAATVPRAA